MRKFKIIFKNLNRTELISILFLLSLVVSLELIFWLSMSMVLNIDAGLNFNKYLDISYAPIFLIVVVSFRLVASLVYAWLLHKTAFTVLVRLRTSLLADSIKGNYSSFESLGKSVLANDITLNSAIIVDTIFINGFKIFNDFLLISSIAIAFIVVHGINVLWITCVLFVLIFIVAFIIRPFIVKWSESIVKANNEVFKNTDYSLYNLKEIKVNSLFEVVSNSCKKVFVDYSSIQTRIRFAQLAPKYIIESLFFLSIGILFYINGSEDGLESLLKATSLIILVGMRVMPLMNQLLISYNGYKSGIGPLNQLNNSFEVLSSQSKLIPVKDISKLISVENVSFKYDSNIILNNFNLSLFKGDMLLLSGPSGSGKTTALDILLGLRKPNKGSIHYQRNIKLYYCSQEPFLPNSSLKDYFKNNTLSTSKWENFSNILSRIGLLDLAKNPDYAIGESGSNLSGGQKQKIAFACALCSDSDVLVLDESMSDLDDVSIDQLMSLVTENSRNSSIIMISHDKDLFKYFNKIIEFPL